MKLPLLALAAFGLAVPIFAQQAKPPTVRRLNPIERNQAIFGDQQVPNMTAKESAISQRLHMEMSASQRKAFSTAVQGVMGLGKVSGAVVMQKAPQRMSSADRQVWNAYVKGLKPVELGVLKKMLQNAALIKPGRTRGGG